MFLDQAVTWPNAEIDEGPASLVAEALRKRLAYWPGSSPTVPFTLIEHLARPVFGERDRVASRGGVSS